MTRLLHIAFDNNYRLKHDDYLFTYRDTAFKLIQNDFSEFSDVLVTVLPDDSDASSEHAYSRASEFLSALAWSNDGRIMLHDITSFGVRAGYDLASAKCHSFSRPVLAYSHYTTGCDITRIVAVETAQQHVALTLFREARGSNSLFLSFIFFWQVLETGGDRAPDFVDQALKSQPAGLRLPPRTLDGLEHEGQTLGAYLQDTCRHAIAHINRYPGKRKLELDSLKERRRLTRSTEVVEAVARYYIAEVLCLNHFLYLENGSGEELPFYVRCEDARMIPRPPFL